jgi:hypothetical protein
MITDTNGKGWGNGQMMRLAFGIDGADSMSASL